MTRFDDFVEQADGAADEYPAVVLPAGAEPMVALSSAMQLFSADDDRGMVHLIVGGEHLGIVRREAVLDLVGTSSKGLGFGEGDGMQLPGIPQIDDLVQLRCPEPGCPEPPVFVVAYDEDHPPRCPQHPASTLEPVR